MVALRTAHPPTPPEENSRRPGVGQKTGSCVGDYRLRSFSNACTVTASSTTQPNAATAATMMLAIGPYHSPDSCSLRIAAPRKLIAAPGATAT